MDETEAVAGAPPPEHVDAGAVVALCQVLDEAHYDRFMQELSATPDAAHAAAVVARWAARVLARARRHRAPGRGAGHQSAPAEPADAAG